MLYHPDPAPMALATSSLFSPQGDYSPKADYTNMKTMYQARLKRDDTLYIYGVMLFAFLYCLLH